MNKKKLLITLLVGVMSLVLVNAAIVSYLSNTMQVDVTVESPFEVIGLDSTPILVTGGDSFVYDFQVTNLADSEKPMILEVIVEANEIDSWVELDFTTELDEFVVFKLGTHRSTSSQTECESRTGEWDEDGLGYCMWDVKASQGRTFVNGNKITYYYGLHVPPVGGDMETAVATIYPASGDVNDDDQTDDRIYVTFAQGIAPGDYTFLAKVIPKSELSNNY